VSGNYFFNIDFEIILTLYGVLDNRNTKIITSGTPNHCFNWRRVTQNIKGRDGHDRMVVWLTNCICSQ
jgi:hypothetical protein